MLINYEMQLRVRNLTPTLSPFHFSLPFLVQFLIKNRWQQIRNPSRDATGRVNWEEERQEGRRFRFDFGKTFPLLNYCCHFFWPGPEQSSNQCCKAVKTAERKTFPVPGIFLTLLAVVAVTEFWPQCHSVQLSKLFVERSFKFFPQFFGNSTKSLTFTLTQRRSKSD